MDYPGGIKPSFLENEELEVIFFCGKGGVGKTTCAMASALLIARSRPRARVLLLSTDPAPSLKDSLCGLSPPENLEIKEMDAKEALEKMKRIHGTTIGSIMQLGTIFDEEDVSRLLELSMPGIDEVLGVMEILDYTESSRYGVIILDTAPTGHTLRLLALPGELRRWVRLLDTMMAKPRYLQRFYAGRYIKKKEDEFIEYMDRRLERFNELLRDGKRCEFVPITLPEALSIEETGRLMDFLKSYHLPVRNIVINQHYPRGGCRYCESIYRLHMKYAEEVEERFKGCKTVRIPLELEEVRGAELLKDFSIALEGLPASGGPAAGSGAETCGGLGLLSRPVACPEAPLLLFVGKGGVGKTTLASATALHLARNHPDKKYLVVSIDPAHSLSDALGRSLGGKGYSILPNLLALEVDPRGEFEALRDIYAEELEGFFDTLTGGGTAIEFEEEVLVELAELSPPGLDEVIALWKVVESQSKEGYDTIILDAAPTGHFLRFLETPGLVEEWLRAIFQLFLKYRGLFRMPRFEAFLV
ncbi:MAG TPA: ArsA family ATPase, partial [Candidatus Hypogeohydataceae bacterium YC38]